MEIKDLIKAIDTEGVLDKETTATLIKNAEDSILAKCSAAKEEGKAEGKAEAIEEAKCKIQDAEKLGYERGVKQSLTEAETLIKDAEKNGFEAGVTKALQEAETLADEYDTQVVEALKEFVEAYDEYEEAAVEQKVKETEEECTTKVVESLDKYLNTYISEVIPESVVVDYDKMKKLESTFSVIKESLCLTDLDISKKLAQIQESTEKDLQKARNCLKQEVEKRIILESKMEEQNAKILLNEKIADLPIYERNLLINKFSGSTIKEINESFDRVLSDIKDSLITEGTKVTETVVTESEAVKDEKIVESAPQTKVDPRMKRYAELSKKVSAYSLQ